MLRFLIFKLLDIVRLFKPNNWKVIKRDFYTDGTPYIEYYYNGSRYTHVGPDFPPVHKGMKLPIQEAKYESQDITSLVKKFAGPLSTDEPPCEYILYKNVWVIRVNLSFNSLSVKIKQVREPQKNKEILIRRLFGHWSVFGAK